MKSLSRILLVALIAIVSLFPLQAQAKTTKLKALISFPSIFKGEHVSKTDMVKIFTGNEIKVIARVSNRSTARAGDIINVAFDMSRVHIFDKDTERYIVH